MKKFCAVLLTLVMCLSLTACGGADKQPAIDAFNKASDAFDALGSVVNENLALIPEDMEVVSTMNEIADAMLEYKTLLESDEDVTEEQVEEMIAKFAEVEKWSVDSKPVIEEFIAVASSLGDTQPAIDAFNSASTVYDELVEIVNANIESCPQEMIDMMNDMSELLLEYKELLESGDPLTQEVIDEMVAWFGTLEQWAADSIAELGY